MIERAASLFSTRAVGESINALDRSADWQITFDGGAAAIAFDVDGSRETAPWEP